MNVLFCGGGTCGHISPAIAIADTVRKKYKDANIAFIGRKDGKENELTIKSGYPVFEIKIKGLQRAFTIENFKVFSDFLNSITEIKGIFKKFKPDLVIGTGGYVSFPAIWYANKKGIPSFLHESNAVLGLTTKILAKKCNLLLLGSDIETKYKNAIYTGNPLRNGFRTATKGEARKKMNIPTDKKLILSVGGSIGAKKFNDSVLKLMKNYSSKKNNIYHIHSTGHRYYEEIKSEYGEFCKENSRCRILSFIDDMPTALCSADLIISRCGAMTLSEIASSALPSILIPSPNVTNDHQLKNAKYFESHGASLLIEEKDLTEDVLTSSVDSLLCNNKALKSMSDKAKALSVYDSNEKILKLIEDNILA